MDEKRRKRLRDKWRRQKARQRKAKLNKYPFDKQQKEIEQWTLANLALEGKLNIPTNDRRFLKPEEDEYNQLDSCYCSYGPDGLKVVSPTMGPVTIPPSDKARARFGEVMCKATAVE